MGLQLLLDVWAIAQLDCPVLRFRAVLPSCAVKGQGMVSTAPYALVVDDDAMIQMHACDILEDAGFRCHSVDDGDQAISLLGRQGEEIVLLFSDVEMPGKTNGFALARHAAERWPHIEIVIASGRISPNPGDLPPKATFIPKPFSASTVHSHLQDSLPEGKKPEPLKRAV